MNGKVAKKARQLHKRDAHKNVIAQANYLATAIKPCPRNRIAFMVWRYFARYYFTANHIDEVTKSYERVTKR